MPSTPAPWTDESIIQQHIPLSEESCPTLSAPLKRVLRRIGDGHNPAANEIASAAHEITGLPGSPARDVAIAWLASAIMTAGPTPEEVTALLQGATQRDGLRATSVDEVDGRPVVVVAGSGKKSLPSFNISTPAALIAATCGANVVKMGSHATSSPTGSRDLAASLSIPESVSASGILEQLRKCSFAFVPIESTVPSLNRVYGRRFHTVTPFSFGLAALACPLRPYATVFGLSHPKVDVATQVLTNFGFSRVHATASVNESTGQWADEFAMGSKTVLATLYEHNTVNTVSHKSANFVPVEPAPPPTGAQSPHRRPTGVFTEIITGQAAESRTNVVTAGTGLILHAAGIEPTIQQGQKRAHKALEEGQPHRLLEQLTGVGHDH